MSIAISTGELPKRYIAPLFVSLDACVVQRLARHSETPHGHTTTEVSRPVYRYVTVVGYLTLVSSYCYIRYAMQPCMAATNDLLAYTYASLEIYHMRATETWYKLCVGKHWYKSLFCNNMVSK